MKKETPIIKILDIKKTYIMGQGERKVTTHALKGVSLEITKGEFVAIMGPSGSGKSTLMHILGFLDQPTEGSYLFEKHRTEKMSQDELADIRKNKVGFVFQAFNLLPRTSALDNVILPLLYTNEKEKVMHEKAKKMLKQVGLGERMHHKSNELSGGQQQRVAIARALINSPSVIFADEPTGNLDSKSGDEIMDIFVDLNKKGNTIILVTHEDHISKKCSRTIRLKDGLIVDDMKKKK
jgi:putative ABC transport system ATP-binding protein